MINADHDPYFGKFSLPGVGKRISQDRTRTLTNEAPLVKKAQRGELFALFDGMGSKGQGGADAAEMMCDMVTEFFRKTAEIPASAEGLQQLLLKGNQIIQEWGIDPASNRSIGGCVGTVIWIIDKEAHVFHAGDTAAYYVADNIATRITSTHCNEQGLITSFFGAGESLQFNIQKLQLDHCDFLILLSDGVADLCTEQEILETIYQNKVDQAPKELVQLAKNKNAKDDLTAIVIDVGEMLL